MYIFGLALDVRSSLKCIVIQFVFLWISLISWFPDGILSFLRSDFLFVESGWRAVPGTLYRFTSNCPKILGISRKNG